MLSLSERARNAVAVLVHRAVDGEDGLFNAALERHRIRAGSHGLHALAVDRLGQNGRRRGAVTGDVAGLAGDFLHHLRAHVLQRVLQLDFLGHGHAVLGDERRAKLLLDNYVAALGAERHLDCVCHDVYAAENRLTGFLTVNNLFCHC